MRRVLIADGAGAFSRELTGQLTKQGSIVRVMSRRAASPYLAHYLGRGA